MSICLSAAFNTNFYQVIFDKLILLVLLESLSLGLDPISPVTLNLSNLKTSDHISHLLPPVFLKAPSWALFYLLPIGTIFMKFGINFHCYVADTTLFVILA